MALAKDPGEEYVRRTNRFVLTVLAAAMALLLFIVVYSVSTPPTGQVSQEIPGSPRSSTSPGTR